MQQPQPHPALTPGMAVPLGTCAVFFSGACHGQEPILLWKACPGGLASEVSDSTTVALIIPAKALGTASSRLKEEADFRGLTGPPPPNSVESEELQYWSMFYTRTHTHTPLASTGA